METEANKPCADEIALKAGKDEGYKTKIWPYPRKIVSEILWEEVEDANKNGHLPVSITVTPVTADFDDKEDHVRIFYLKGYAKSKAFKKFEKQIKSRIQNGLAQKTD